MTLRLKLDATRLAITTSVRTRSAASVWAQNTIGRATRQMHSGIWQSLTRSRRLIPGGLGDRHPHASALTGRTESSFEKFFEPVRCVLARHHSREHGCSERLMRARGGLLRFAHIAHFLFYNSRIVIL